MTIYLDKNYTSKGIGKKLYKILIEILKLQGIKNIYACVTLSNKKSEKFHKSLGFNIVGVFYNTGYKCGKWHDVVYFEKSISNHDLNPNPFIPINKIESERIKEILRIL